MELDTGGSVSLISERVWKVAFPVSELVSVHDTLLKTYTGEKLSVLGNLQVVVEYNSQENYLSLVIVAGKIMSLSGRNWLKVLFAMFTIGEIVTQLPTGSPRKGIKKMTN